MLRAGKVPGINCLATALVLQLLWVWVLVLLLRRTVLLLLLLRLLGGIKHLLTVLWMLKIRLNLALQLDMTLAVVMVSEVFWGIRGICFGVRRRDRPNCRVRLAVEVV